MKLKLTLFLLIVSLGLFSQTDSTTIQFTYLEQDLSLINNLNDIKYIKLSCSDKEMKGKRFLLTFDEYKDGVIINKDTSNLNCTIQNIPVVMGKDTAFYVFDPCNKMTYHQEDSVFEIRLAGKFQTDTFKLLINYPGIVMTKKFAGNSDYSFRETGCSSESRLTVPVNKLTPVLVYTPPFQIEGGIMSSYCMLGMEEIGKWYEKFNVRHYYVINLRIE